MEDQYQVESVVRGYHVYHNVWDVIVDEKLVCAVETDNPRDRFAVGVYKNNNIVGHIPRKFSAVCSLFLRRGGVITSEIIGGRSYSHDLPQGGMEISCIYVFQGNEADVSKIKKFFAVVFPAGILNKDANNSYVPPPKKKKIDEN